MASISLCAARHIAHPLYIPEILAQVAIHLDKPDLASACRVQKDWLEPFAALLWRSIPSEAFYTDGFVESCLKYQHFIRELSCPLIYPILELRLHLTRLTALTLPVMRSDGTLVSIVEANKDTLQSLTIERIQCLDTKIGFETLSMLKHLRCLDLKGPRLPLLYIKGILCQLPVLQDLRLREEGAFSIEEVEQDSGFTTPPEVLTCSDGTQTFGLRRLDIRSSYGAFHPLLSIATFSPVLENLEIQGDYNVSDPTVVAETVRELAKTLRHSCSRLQNLALETRWVGPTEDDYVLVLKGILNDDVAPPLPPLAMHCSSDNILRPWTGLRSLRVDGDWSGLEGTVECDYVLYAIWEGRQTLQDTLEEIIVPCHNTSSFYSLGSKTVEILCHFKNLRVYDVGEGFLPLRHLFREPLNKGCTFEIIERNISPWACKDLEVLSLGLLHEDKESDWCPGEWDLRQVDMYDIAELTAKFGETYPIFIAIKHFLSTFPKLDQKQIMFSLS